MMSPVQEEEQLHHLFPLSSLLVLLSNFITSALLTDLSQADEELYIFPGSDAFCM